MVLPFVSITSLEAIATLYSALSERVGSGQDIVLDSILMPYLELILFTLPDRLLHEQQEAHESTPRLALYYPYPSFDL